MQFLQWRFQLWVIYYRLKHHITIIACGLHHLHLQHGINCSAKLSTTTNLVCITHVIAWLCSPEVCLCKWHTGTYWTTNTNSTSCCVNTGASAQTAQTTRPVPINPQTKMLDEQKQQNLWLNRDINIYLGNYGLNRQHKRLIHTHPDKPTSSNKTLWGRNAQTSEGTGVCTQTRQTPSSPGWTTLRNKNNKIGRRVTICRSRPTSNGSLLKWWSQGASKLRQTRFQ